MKPVHRMFPDGWSAIPYSSRSARAILAADVSADSNHTASIFEQRLGGIPVDA
jgi:hypothetical protein